MKSNVDTSYRTVKTVKSLAVVSIIVGLASMVAINYNKNK